MSRKTVPALFTAIFRLLLHLGLKIWHFRGAHSILISKLPFILIPSITMDQMSTLRRQKQQLRTNSFLNKKTSIEYVIQYWYGSLRVPIVSFFELKGSEAFWWVPVKVKLQFWVVLMVQKICLPLWRVLIDREVQNVTEPLRVLLVFRAPYWVLMVHKWSILILYDP